MEIETVLVTGAAGLLGNHFSRYLLNQGHTVIGIDNLSGGYRDWLPEHQNFTFEKLDLQNYDRLRSIYAAHKPSRTYHFAAYAAEGLSPFIRMFNYTNNLVSSASVINCCIESESKLVFTSSMAVYGGQETPFRENMQPRPIDPYGIAKFAVEEDIKLAGLQFDLQYSIIRPHNVVGIYQNIWDRYRNVLGIFIRRAIAGQPLLVYGDGKQLRAFSDIKYYMEPFDLLGTNPNGETYNLGADEPITIRELAELVVHEAEKHGLHPEIEHVEARHEAFEAFCDHAKAKSELGFHDKTDIEATVVEMFNWALSQPMRSETYMEYEVTKNLYSYWKH